MLASYLEGRLINFLKTDNVGICTAYSANSNVTNSAAAETALLTRFKTNNGKDLIKIAKENGFDYITTKEELLNYNYDKVLGLFSYNHLPLASEKVSKPMLPEMTKKALEILSKDG